MGRAQMQKQDCHTTMRIRPDNDVRDLTALIDRAKEGGVA